MFTYIEYKIAQNRIPAGLNRIPAGLEKEIDDRLRYATPGSCMTFKMQKRFLDIAMAYYASGGWKCTKDDRPDEYHEYLGELRIMVPSESECFMGMASDRNQGER